VRGIRLVEGAQAEDFDSLEDLLYSAAVLAGWLAGYGHPQEVAEVPDIDIIVGALLVTP
jgi:hypothetical protein